VDSFADWLAAASMLTAQDQTLRALAVRGLAFLFVHLNERANEGIQGDGVIGTGESAVSSFVVRLARRHRDRIPGTSCHAGSERGRGRWPDGLSLRVS
jgi:hypothetical protein